MIISSSGTNALKLNNVICAVGQCFMVSQATTDSVMLCRLAILTQ